MEGDEVEYVIIEDVEHGGRYVVAIISVVRGEKAGGRTDSASSGRS